MKRKPVARYATHGPFAGRVVILRHTEGDQLWFVRVSVTRGDITDTHDIEPKERVPLRAITEIVMGTIKEILGENDRVNEAQMEFFVR